MRITIDYEDYHQENQVIKDLDDSTEGVFGSNISFDKIIGKRITKVETTKEDGLVIELE